MSINHLNIRQLIPIAAGAAVLVLGCSREHSDARKYCKTWKDCNSTSFDEEFDSVGDCAKVYGKYGEANVAELRVVENNDCVKSYRKLNKCMLEELNCDAFPDYPEDPADDATFEELEAWQEATQEARETYDDWEEDTYDACENEYNNYDSRCD